MPNELLIVLFVMVVILLNKLPLREARVKVTAHTRKLRRLT